MAVRNGTIRRRLNGSWELRLQKKGLLPKPVYMTFETHEEALRYGERAMELLERGVVPPELSGGPVEHLGALLDEYEATVTLSPSDEDLLPTVRRAVAKVAVSRFDYTWVENWVEDMRKEGLAPSTLTKRVGLLARGIDWALRKGRLALPSNPLRVLPKGYASKGRQQAWHGERARRMSTAEEGALRSVITEKEELLLFDMALETGMRLREMYTLTVDQVDLAQSTIFLDKTKNGDRRQVPVTTVLAQKLRAHLAAQPEGATRVFPTLWDGDSGRHALANTSQRISHRFAYRVRQVELKDLRFHDLRHEATSRFFERTQLSDTEIASITGHKDPRMLKRYANLRGSRLAAKLW